MGILITIEAGDGSGKQTQTQRLLSRLQQDGENVMSISFPDYESDSSALVKMYLSGQFGEKAEDVSPYVASVFFAVDRYASFTQKWKDFYDEGGIVIADRYTTANMIHQAIKYDDNINEKEKFLEWLTDFEYNIMGIPKPDLTFFLDVPVEKSIEIIEQRDNKIDGSKTKDIHERDKSHLVKAYQAAIEVGHKYNWHRIRSTKDGKFRAIEDIHQDIYAIVKDYIATKR